MSRPALQRCAIYTRKSSDEGLDQAFNSLDAQREAGEAFIKSQAHEGWQALPARYDDGGYSGGTMERPALQRLLADVDAGRIDVVVVYKIDRLTRSLADFARIVERFDARGVSFVSVTQAFNTTSSMGRLTLNVLLSFAQFEREVTGERIRDKIAASKAKGMWMGGIPPLGYDIPIKGSRSLVINEDEAEHVRSIYSRYLALGSVHALQAELAARGIVSKCWTTTSGRTLGGVPFSRGALFHLLQNRVYRGQIVHKDTVHEGEHPPILDQQLFDAVQQTLARNRRQRSATGERRTVSSALVGKLFDATGQVMSPTHSRGRGGRLYRYYVSTSLQRGKSDKQADIVQRVPASAIETLVGNTLASLARHRPITIAEVRAVHLAAGSIRIHLSRTRRQDLVEVPEDITIERSGRDLVVIKPVHLPLRGGTRAIASAGRTTDKPDPILITALRRAHAMLERDRNGPIINQAPESHYERRVLRLALLAPCIQRDILAGRQPPGFNLQAFIKSEVPLSWAEQRQAYRWD